MSKAERLQEAEQLLYKLRDEGKPIHTAACTTVIASCKQVQHSTDSAFVDKRRTVDRLALLAGFHGVVCGGT